MFFPPQGCRNLRGRQRWTLFGVPHLQSLRSPFLARKSLSGQGSVEYDLSSGDQAVGLIESPTMLDLQAFSPFLSQCSFLRNAQKLHLLLSCLSYIIPHPNQGPHRCSSTDTGSSLVEWTGGAHGHDFYPGLHHSSLCPL